MNLNRAVMIYKHSELVGCFDELNIITCVSSQLPCLLIPCQKVEAMKHKKILSMSSLISVTSQAA